MLTSDKDHYTCPVCGYDGLDEPPYTMGCGSFDICPCCGVEFGYHDARTPHEVLRARWWQGGAGWHFPQYEPPGWSAIEQLRRAGFGLPRSHDEGTSQTDPD
ncbi:MAG: hypothetical protein LC772_02390 [Chloroflexi bacterium]|nr:hypothetical protein [Chloroflexota bacterium]